MSKEQLVKKAGFYTIFLVASTLFIYFTLSAALYPYSAKLDSLPAGTLVSEKITEGIMLPFVFSTLSLVILGLFQFLLIKPESATEKRIFSLVLIIFFSLGLAMSILVLVGAVKESALGAILGIIPPATLSIAEIILGVIRLLEANKLLAQEENNPAK
jgi:hypothetical protein